MKREQLDDTEMIMNQQKRLKVIKFQSNLVMPVCFYQERNYFVEVHDMTNGEQFNMVALAQFNLGDLIKSKNYMIELPLLNPGVEHQRD